MFTCNGYARRLGSPLRFVKRSFSWAARPCENEDLLAESPCINGALFVKGRAAPIYCSVQCRLEQRPDAPLPTGVKVSC